MSKSPVRIWREAKERYQFLGKKGRLISFTKIFNPPKEFVKQRPYWVGVVKFKNGKKTTAQLVVEGENPKVGRIVVGVMRRLQVADEKSVIEYGVKFKLL